jgi:hypothetical protein
LWLRFYSHFGWAASTWQIAKATTAIIAKSEKIFILEGTRIDSN